MAWCRPRGRSASVGAGHVGLVFGAGAGNAARTSWHLRGRRHSPRPIRFIRCEVHGAPTGRSRADGERERAYREVVLLAVCAATPTRRSSGCACCTTPVVGGLCSGADCWQPGDPCRGGRRGRHHGEVGRLPPREARRGGLSRGDLRARTKGRPSSVIRRSGIARAASSSRSRFRPAATTSPPRSSPKPWTRRRCSRRRGHWVTSPPSTAARSGGGRGRTTAAAGC